jgi:Tol biopolymer transport system component
MKKIVFLVTLILYAHIMIFAQTNDPAFITGSFEEPALSPYYSPDGSMIAFTRAGYTGLFVYELSTGNITQLTDEASAGFAFRWSSDSKSILCRVARYDDNRKYNSIKIYNIDTGEANQLTEESTSLTFLPEWIPGNDRVILPQKDEVEIFETGKEPFFTENENEIVVYSLYDRIVVRDFSNSDENVLIPFPGSDYLNISLSPDRTKIVFEVYGGNLFVINTDGTGLTDLGKGYNAKWSGDSWQLVYMITEDDGHTFTSSDIYLINIDGSSKTNITSTDEIIELNPSISPDGTSVVYESYNDGAIYLMKLD